MRDTDLFKLALGLTSPWKVMRAEFSAGEGQLFAYVDFPSGSRFVCAECEGEGCGVHDTKTETWRNLDFFQHRAFLHARTPRVICPKCGVHEVAVPWARAGSGFTLLFETYVLALAKIVERVNGGHIHEPCIKEAAYFAGTYSSLPSPAAMRYASKGPGARHHSTIVTYQSDKRTIVTFQNGTYRVRSAQLGAKKTADGRHL